MRARKIDANLPAIAQAAERMGFLVHRTNADWDLTVQLHGTVELWEVKNRKGKNRLTPRQVKLLGDGWKIHRVESVEDVQARALDISPWIHSHQREARRQRILNAIADMMFRNMRMREKA